MQSVRASTLIPRGFVADDAVNTLMARSSPCVLRTRRASVQRAEQYPAESTVDIPGILRICRLQDVGFVSCFAPGVSAAVPFSAGVVFSMSGSTQMYWRHGRGEPLGSTISCIISRSLWAADRRRASPAA
jgi:hypothetical protein